MKRKLKDARILTEEVNKPLVSIIILNWNGKKWLENCYNSLRMQSFKNFEIILADNASIDGSVEFTKSFYPEVKIAKLENNLGYSKANNLAANKAKGEYLFFLNNDTKLDPFCLEELVSYTENKDLYIAAIHILDYNERCENKNKVSLKLGIGIGIDLLGFPLLSNKIFYADGSALFIKKDLFIKLGGFDEKHFMFAEDIDLCWRAQLLGYKIISVPSAISYHEKGGTIVGSKKKGRIHITSKKRRYFTERNTLRNLLKNYQWYSLIWVLPVYFVFLIAEMLFFITIGKIELIWEIYIKALLYNIKMFPDTMRERRKIQRLRKISDLKLMKNITFKIGKIESFKKVGIPIFK